MEFGAVRLIPDRPDSVQRYTDSRWIILAKLLHLIRCLPLRAVNPVNQRGLSQQLGGTMQALTQSLRHPNRSRVLRVDQADDVRLFQLGEGKLESGPGPFGGVPPAPEGSAQGPAEFKPRPALGIPEADVPDQNARRALLGSPKAVAAQ